MLSYIFIGIIVVVAFIRFKPEKKPATTELYSMNTIIDIEIYGPDKEKAINNVISEIHQINKLTDDFSQYSDVYSINQNAGIKPIKVNPITIDMISKAVEVAKETNGSFDPTIYPISKLWGFKNGNYNVPMSSKINQILQFINYKNIVINKQNETVFLNNKGEGIDLGGIAKGYTLDKIKQILSLYNISSALINMGGNILTYKSPADGSKFWKIGIKNPRGDGIVGIIKVEGTKFISTSGDYERFFIKNGIRYCHILDPFTGYPARKVVSVTVVSDKGYVGDALSTAFFVQGQKYTLENSKKFDVEAVGFNNNLKYFITENLINCVTFEK